MNSQLEQKIQQAKKTRKNKKALQEAAKLLKKSKSPRYLEKQRKQLEKEVVKGFCNPGCKGTIFEEGDPNSLPTGLPKKNRESLRILRKGIFQNKTNVLQNDFYKHWKKSHIDTLKQAGAISGCTLLPLPI
jgi:hypothetical protein